MSGIVIQVSDIIAAAGFGLGLFNLYEARQKEKPKLILTSIAGRRGPLDPDNIPTVISTTFLNQNLNYQFGYRIQNQRDNPITISEIGFLIRKKDGRITCPIPFRANGEHVKLPIKIDQRNSIDLYTSIEFLLKSDGDINKKLCKRRTKIFLTTACGETVYSRSGVLKQLLKAGRKSELVAENKGSSFKWKK